MGWLFYNDRRINCYADEKAEITRLCTFDTETRITKLTKASKVGSTWYAAVKVAIVDGSPAENCSHVIEADGSYTFGAVFLTGYNDGCWGYKNMDECMGPCESEAPPGILALLSDLKGSNSYAHDWRQRCRANAAISVYKEGDRIKLAAPVTLTDGSVCQIVTVTHYNTRRQKRRCYRIEGSGSLIRLSKAALAGSVLLSCGTGAASPVLQEFFAGSQS